MQKDSFELDQQPPPPFECKKTKELKEKIHRHFVYSRPGELKTKIQNGDSEKAK